MDTAGSFQELVLIYQRAGRFGDRIPVAARLFAPVQTGPDALPASYAMGTGFLPGVKRPGRGVEHPLTSSAAVKERVELYLYSLSGPSWPLLGWTLNLRECISLALFASIC